MFAAARVVVTFGVILQFAGFGKLLIIADYFGAGATLDAYYLALVAPTFLASISAGILQSSFVPEYIRVRATGGPALAQHVRNYALTWTVVVLTMVSVLASCLPPSVLSILSHGSGPQVHRQLEVAFSVLIWSTPVSGFADAGAMLLNAEGRFFAAASAPVANVAISVLTLLCWPQTTIDALIWSLLAGVAAQALVVAAALYRAGLSVRPSFAVPERLSRALTHIALPVIVSSVLTNFIPAFIQVAAARAGPGAVSAMGYASRLHNSLVQAVVMSVSVVLLPHFARLTAERREAELQHTLERVFAATLLFAAAALVMVASGGYVAISLLLQRGQFTEANASLVATTWLALTCGLLGGTWGTFLARVFQARRKPVVIAILAVALLAANVGLCWLLLPRWGVVGIGLANALAYLLVALLTQRLSGTSWAGPLGRRTLRFTLLALGANGAAFLVATVLGMAGRQLPAYLVLAAQFVVVMCANLAVARAQPLGVPVRALFGRL